MQHAVGNAYVCCTAGTGCLGCLSSKDWSVRKRAAEALHALAHFLGPDLEAGTSAERRRVPRCLEYLKAIKHDKVKPTREALAASVAAFEDLAGWLESHPVSIHLLLQSAHAQGFFWWLLQCIAAL